MTTLIAICGQPLVHALGWTLLHLCWQGTLVALVLWCVLEVLDGRSSRVRYAAACLALGLMVALPLATFAHLASGEYRARDAFDGPAVAIDPGMVLQVGAGEMSAPWPERISMALDHALPWIILAWFAGVILFVVRLNVGLLVARRMTLVATTAVPDELRQAFDALRRRLGVERAVRLMHSALVQAPTVIGWLRPVVLIPASCLTGLSAMQIEAILAHELAHIRRHDYLVSVLQSVIETLLFYHPAVWWVSRQVRRERECCCDELAVAVGGDRLAYARALSVLEERRAAMPELALGANGGVLAMRIRRLLGCGRASISSQLAAGMVLAVLLVVGGSYVATMARAEVSALSHAMRAASPMELEAATPLNTLIAEPAVRQFQLKAPVTMAQAEAPAAPASPPQSPPKYFDRGVSAALDGPAHDLGPGAGMISWALPVYPPEAKAAGIQGVVAMRVTISNTGTVEDVQVISGPQELRQSAIDAVKQWKFDPAWDHGFSVGVKTIGVIYNLPSVVPVVGPVPPAEEAAAGVKQYGGDVAAPMIISQPSPEYTELARRDNVEGVVTVGLVVDEHGLPQHVKLLRGLGDGLDEKALDAAKKYVFKPGMENGKPVPVFMYLSVDFKLLDAAASQGTSGVSQGAVPVPVVPLPTPSPPRLFVPSMPAVPGGPVRISAGTASGMVISKVDPVYPAIAKAAHVQGPVILHAIISKDGTIERLDVISGNGMLVDAARDAVSQWKFKPYLLNGQPTEVETSITENFSLADSLAQGATNQTVFTQAEQRYKELLALEGTAQGAANRAAITQAEQEYREFLALEPKQIGGDVKGPVILYQPEPEYTAEAKKAKFMGVVTVGIIVDKNGMPQNVHVTRGVGMGLDEKAVEAVKQYKFKPAMENGNPVAVYMNVEVNFEIF
jgi:TonB family protein